MTAAPGPRVFGLTARDADVVAVVRRGPSAWCALGRWEPGSGRYEQGSWLRGTLYPQRCDLSPDGRWFCSFVLDNGADWPAGWTYVSVSRLPWLRSLAAWGTDGTWTRGLHFTDSAGESALGKPDVGDAGPLPYGLAWTRAASFAVERRRGWTETADSTPRGEGDVWDERRAEHVVVGRPRPGDPGLLLTARGGRAAHRSMDARWYGPADYRLVGPAGESRLVGVQWADWSLDGALLVATADGRLQVRDPVTGAERTDADLAALEPDPQPAPEDAGRW